MKKSSGSSSSGIETSTSSIRKFSSPQPYMSENLFSYDIPAANPPHPPATVPHANTAVQEENARLQQEVGRLHKMLEWSFNLLTETQKNLISTKSQLKVLYHRHFDHDPVQSRRISLHISPSSEGRIRKVSRSVDSIQHELMQLQLEQEAFPEMTEPAPLSRLPTAMLNQKSPRLHAKTAKGHK